MAIKNRIDTSSNGESQYMDTRDFKETADGITIRLCGDQEMGFSYFQKIKKEDGSDGVTVVRSLEVPTMENQTEGFQGAAQVPAKNLYSVVWNYSTESPMLLSLDKVSIINKLFAVDDSEKLGAMTDYDFNISFDKSAQPADKYKVERLDKSELTADQKKALEDFKVDIQAHATGGSAFEADEKVETEEKNDLGDF